MLEENSKLKKKVKNFETFNSISSNGSHHGLLGELDKNKTESEESSKNTEFRAKLSHVKTENSIQNSNIKHLIKENIFYSLQMKKIKQELSGLE